MARVTHKVCKRCLKRKPLGEFTRSAFAKDGRTGFCGGCWSKKMEEASASRSGPTRTKKVESEKRKPKNGHAPVIQAANEALKSVGAIKEKFLVRANDGDLAEFISEEKALRQAMEWKMGGFAVTVWRQCEFEMVLRIIG